MGCGEQHFHEAVKADDKLAEAHDNLALALDKLGQHGRAKESFAKALELASDNPAIAESEILQKHVNR